MAVSFIGGGIPENPEKTTDLPQVTDILVLLRKSSISIPN
jgi:hypothetical protein